MLRGIGRFNAEQSSDDDAESQPTPFRFDIKCSSIAPIPTQLRGEDGHDVDVVLNAPVVKLGLYQAALPQMQIAICSCYTVAISQQNTSKAVRPR
jgi:hypothetical protein